MNKNNTVEEINISIHNLLEEWNISREHNDKIVTQVIGLQLRKIRIHCSLIIPDYVLLYPYCPCLFL